MSVYSDLVLADGATSYFRMDEASGTLANATSGAALDQVAGSPTYLQDPYCPLLINSIDFASAAKYGNLGTAEKITTKGSFEFWFNADTQVGSPLSRDTYGNYSNGPYTFLMGGDGSMVLDKQNSAGQRFEYPAGTFVNGTWYHVVTTVDALGGASSVKGYVDGVAVTPSTDTLTAAFVDTGNHLIIGAQGFSLARQYFDGRIDEVALYKDVVLTGAQALAHFEAACDDTSTGDFWSWG